MAFSFVRGNPDNLTSGGAAAMGDIQGPLYDIRDYLNSAANLVAQGILFLGEVRFIAVPAAPALWLPADGRVISRVTYSALFAAISTTYGAGDGVNTFGIPPVAGRVLMGSGAGSGLTARTAGTQLGEETHPLTAAESGVNGNGLTTSGGVHGHDMKAASFGGAAPPVLNPGDGRQWVAVEQSSGTGGSEYGIQMTGLGSFRAGFTVADGGTHQHPLTARNADNAHNVVQPSLVVPAYIYAGV